MLTCMLIAVLIRLFKYDNSYDEEEKAFMKPVLTKLGISKEVHDKLEKLADEYTKVYNNICDLLNN